MFRIIFGLLLIFVPFFMFGTVTYHAFLGAGLVAWGVLALNRRSAANSAFGDGFKYAFTGGGTGIAISPERRLLKLREKANVKEYPFEMIRSWKTNLQTGGMAVHGGSSLTGASNVGAANLGRTIANKRASGLFVYTKDLDKTEWRIEIFRTQDQAKWMEILEQCINEG